MSYSVKQSWPEIVHDRFMLASIIIVYGLVNLVLHVIKLHQQ